MNSSTFPKVLGIMRQNADPVNASSLIADMATVFAKTNLHGSDMRKILPMKLICDPIKLREGPEVDVMTVGLIMENLSKLSARGPRAHKVIYALSKYANEAVDDAGNLLNSKYQNAWIAHGRRAEVDLLADAPLSLIFGGRIELEVFTKKGFKSSSDVEGAGRVDFNTSTNVLEEASGPMTAISIKRAGRTVDNFFTENEKKPWFKDDAWIKAYLKSIKDGTGKVGDGNYIPPCPRLLILSGNGLPDAAIKARLDRLATKVGGIVVEFKAFKSPPPPSN